MATDARGEKIGVPARLEKTAMEILANTVRYLIIYDTFALKVIFVAMRPNGQGPVVYLI
jgi:hypothetical protein